MEEKSLRVYDTEKTFFSKITNKLSKWLSPGKGGINNFLINMKRNNVLKHRENYIKYGPTSDRKGVMLKKYEEAYSLYLEAIDKNIIEAIYKKVKNNEATEFEKNALSRYYMVIHLKDVDYNEYKLKKQKFLLELDKESVDILGKDKLKTRYQEFYYEKLENLYKNLIKQFSIRLVENITENEKIEIYKKIFELLDEYVSEILPRKMEQEPTKELYIEIKDNVEKCKKLSGNRLAQNEIIEKNMILLGMSRRLFTHSLPLSVAEKCYLELLDEARNLVVDTRVSKKKEKAYELLLDLINEYNLNILSTKVYWDNAEEKDTYRKFWKKYEELENISDKEKRARAREILFIKADLNKVRENENKYYKLIVWYKKKLVEYGVMKHLSAKCKSLKDGIYIEDLVVTKKSKSRAKKVKRR